LLIVQNLISEIELKYSKVRNKLIQKGNSFTKNEPRHNMYKTYK